MFIDMKARCFLEAGRCLNFTRAAEKLYISQPALSKNIAALEEECGMKLFFRDTRHNQVKLTAAGTVMLCELEKMQDILDGVLDKAKRAESGQEGKLTLALLYGQIINPPMAKVLQVIEEEYPKIEIEKVMGGFSDLRNWLEDGTVDVIITPEEEVIDREDLQYDEVQNVQLGFAVPSYHRLAKKRTLRVRNLEGETMVLIDEKESGFAANRFAPLCEAEGVRPHLIKVMDTHDVNMMGELGKGILISKEDSIETRSPNLKFFKSAELGSIRMVAAWRKDNMNPIITFFAKMYEEFYQQ